MPTKRMLFRLFTCLIVFGFLIMVFSFLDFDEMAQSTMAGLRKYPGKFRRFEIRNDELLPFEFEQSDENDQSAGADDEAYGDNVRETRRKAAVEAKRRKYLHLRKERHKLEVQRRRNRLRREKQEEEREREIERELKEEKRKLEELKKSRNAPDEDVKDKNDNSVDSLQFLPDDSDKQGEDIEPQAPKEENEVVRDKEVVADEFDKKVIEFNSPERCPTPGNVMAGVIIIICRDDEFAERLAIRESWAKDQKLVRGRMVHLFHIRRDRDQSVDHVHLAARIKKEWEKHHDIYYSTKRLSASNHFPVALDWARSFCPDASFVVRADTRSFVNMVTLDEHIFSIWSLTKIFFLANYGDDPDLTKIPTLTNYVIGGPLIKKYFDEWGRKDLGTLTESQMLTNIHLKSKFDIARLHVQGYISKGVLNINEMSCTLFKNIYMIWGVDTSVMKLISMKNDGCL